VRFLLIAAAATTAASGQSPSQAADTGTSGGRQGNVWGINLGWDSGFSTAGTTRLLGLARTLVGDWGYLRHGISPDADVERVRRNMAMVRAFHLIPICGGAYPDKRFCEEGKPYPRLDADGTMRTAAKAKAAIWRTMYEAGIPFYAVEVMNEVNIGNAFPPEKYAQWLLDFAIEVKQAYPGLKVCSCGMAGSGAEYYDRMLAYRPELKDVVDFWGLHPYGANNPPEVAPAETTLRSYELTARVLAKHGVSPIRLMCTETGYELEIGPTGKNPAHPPIREDNRAEYMARAFRDYYVPDERIEMVAPFMLWDLPWHGWDGWAFMDHDGRPKPIYYACMREPKSPGRDWMPTGNARIAGRVTWSDSGIGVPRVVVYTEPGLYGGVTNDRGEYEITGLPPGAYRVEVFSDSCRPVPPHQVQATADTTVRYDVRVELASLVPAHFGEAWDPPTARHPVGWTAIGGLQAHEYVLDPQTRAPEGGLALRLSGRADAVSRGVYTYGPYNSAYPNEVYVAEVMVRSTGASDGRRFESGTGPWLELAACNGRGTLLSTARAFAPDFRADGRWHRITAALLGPPRTSRLRITLGVDKADGDYWFSAPFVGEADFPLPGDARYRTTGYVPPLYEQNRELFAQTVIDMQERHPDLTTGTITGQITDFRDRPIAHACVSSDSPVFVAVTDADGRYRLTVPAGMPVRVRAIAPGVEGAISEPIQVAANESEALDLKCPALPAPAGLVNGGFNQFVPGQAGLLEGWFSFGDTDGTTASTQTIFAVPSYEGEGLYFAQAGSNVKNGGAYQTVQAVPGVTYRFSARVYTRTEGSAAQPLDNNCRIGIDPTGGHDPNSPDVIWSAPTESEQQWTQLAVEATARYARLTVFIRHEMRRANVWNLTLFDDARLETLP